ncbi:MAG: 50S ribosomal protein L30 [Candidatus Acidiferrales bacterium]|jgi:large subunit ribosomal protein L30|nr:50S ribosomal protein L30 [Candidatus Acidoferrales bacterium]HLJ40415.1 50S ribosomal protein L30 [Candidatus Acidoferrales bacterium]
MATKKKSGKLKIRWVVSFIGCPRSMRQTIRGMGFRRMNQLVELDDTPSTRGMIARVHHLVKIEPEKEDTKKGANAA